MKHITNDDLTLINNLSSRKYKHNSLLTNASSIEKEHLINIKQTLKTISLYFKNKYDDTYGPFEHEVVKGNDIAIGGTNFKRIWSGIFKGAENKQYAAQISFVLNPHNKCLDVGFYFGSASGHSRNKEERVRLESELKKLGSVLEMTVSNEAKFNQDYLNLFDNGFMSYTTNERVTSTAWLSSIAINPKNSFIISKLYPNEFGIIEMSEIDAAVSNIIFLMGGIPNPEVNFIPTIKPITPQQMIKKMERLAEIGTKGELYIMEQEAVKLNMLGIDNKKYPKHSALESTAYGYDVLSLNEHSEEIFIEVKTTSRLRNDIYSNKFYLSSHEYKTYESNLNNYKLYRVYDIEGDPNFDIIDLQTISKTADGYICKYELT